MEKVISIPEGGDGMYPMNEIINLKVWDACGHREAFNDIFHYGNHFHLGGFRVDPRMVMYNENGIPGLTSESLPNHVSCI